MSGSSGGQSQFGGSGGMGGYGRPQSPWMRSMGGMQGYGAERGRMMQGFGPKPMDMGMGSYSAGGGADPSMGMQGPGNGPSPFNQAWMNFPQTGVPNVAGATNGGRDPSQPMSGNLGGFIPSPNSQTFMPSPNMETKPAGQDQQFQNWNNGAQPFNPGDPNARFGGMGDLLQQLMAQQSGGQQSFVPTQNRRSFMPTGNFYGPGGY